jgi:hypothetical protein
MMRCDPLCALVVGVVLLLLVVWSRRRYRSGKSLPAATKPPRATRDPKPFAGLTLRHPLSCQITPRMPGNRTCSWSSAPNFLAKAHRRSSRLWGMSSQSLRPGRKKDSCPGRVAPSLRARPSSCPALPSKVSVTDHGVCCQFSADSESSRQRGGSKQGVHDLVSSYIVCISRTTRMPCQQRSVASKTSLTRHTPA